MIIFLATFVYVLLKAFQQLNVVGYHYRLVLPVSFGMAITECVIVLTIAIEQSLWLALPMGLGGGMGACLAMYLHKRYVK